MQDVKITWQLPTTRASGRPFPVSEIQHVTLEVSADLGTTYGKITDVAAPATEYTMTQLEDGEWRFRGRVVDTAGKPGVWTEASVILDNSAPGALVNLTLTPVV